jgi:hypothetical protein
MQASSQLTALTTQQAMTLFCSLLTLEHSSVMPLHAEGVGFLKPHVAEDLAYPYSSCKLAIGVYHI